MVQTEYYELSGHLFEVVPTSGNGHIGYIKPSDAYPSLYEATSLEGQIRYFKNKGNGIGSYIEVEKPEENIITLKTA